MNNIITALGTSLYFLSAISMESFEEMESPVFYPPREEVNECCMDYLGVFPLETAPFSSCENCGLIIQPRHLFSSNESLDVAEDFSFENDENEKNEIVFSDESARTINKQTNFDWHGRLESIPKAHCVGFPQKE